MNVKKVTSIIVSALLIALIVVIPFFLNNDALMNNKTVYTFFLISKIAYVLLFVVSVIICVAKEQRRGTILFLFTLVILLQGVAPLMRLGTLFEKEFIFCFSTLIVSLIIASAGIGSIILMSKVQKANDEQFQGKEIEVKQDLPDKF